MNSLRKIAQASVLVCIIATNAMAQNSTSNREFFVRIENLDNEGYARLYHAVKADSRFVIDVVCVPAQVMKIISLAQNSAEPSANLEAFQLLATKVQLNKPILLTNYDEKKFTEACSAARVGN